MNFDSGGMPICCQSLGLLYQHLAYMIPMLRQSNHYDDYEEHQPADFTSLMILFLPGQLFVVDLHFSGSPFALFWLGHPG